MFLHASKGFCSSFDFKYLMIALEVSEESGLVLVSFCTGTLRLAKIGSWSLSSAIALACYNLLSGRELKTKSMTRALPRARNSLPDPSRTYGSINSSSFINLLLRRQLKSPASHTSYPRWRVSSTRLRQSCFVLAVSSSAGILM